MRYCWLRSSSIWLNTSVRMLCYALFAFVASDCCDVVICTEFCKTLRHLQFPTISHNINHLLTEILTVWHTYSSSPVFSALFLSALPSNPCTLHHWSQASSQIQTDLEVFLNSPCSKMLSQGVPQCVVQAVSIITAYCTTLPEHTFSYSRATRMLRVLWVCTVNKLPYFM